VVKKGQKGPKRPKTAQNGPFRGHLRVSQEAHWASIGRNRCFLAKRCQKRSIWPYPGPWSGWGSGGLGVPDPPKPGIFLQKRTPKKHPRLESHC
jgi:hypothetical protein